METVIDQEAFQGEYVEQQELLHELNVIQAAQAALDAEKKKAPDQRRYARIARKYLPDLRRIFWTGQMKDEAQALIDDLSLESTVPFNDLEGEWEEVKGQYQDVDPMTKEDPIEALKKIEEEKKRQEQLQADQEEVFDELQELKALKRQDEFDKILFSIANKVIDYYSPPPTVITAEPIKNDPLMPLDLPYSKYDEEEEDEWYEEGEIPSVPLSQEEHLMMKGTERLPDLREEMQPYIRAIKNLARQEAAHFKRLQNEFVEYLITVKGPKDVEDESKNPYIQEFYVQGRKWVRHDWKWENLAATVKNTIYVSGPWGFNMGYGWYMRLWYGRMRQVVETSEEVQRFIEALDQISPKYEPQDVAYVFLSVQSLLPSDRTDEETEEYDWASLESTAGKIRAVGYQSLLAFLEEWGDTILEEALWRDGGLRITTTDQILKVSKYIDESLVNTYKDNPRAKTAAERAQTKSFFRGILDALEAGSESQLTEAGHDRWRNDVSDVGNRAYHRVLRDLKPDMTEEERRTLYKKAWSAFWHAGKIVRLTPSKVEVLEVASGEKKLIDWPLAAWKIKNGEIEIPPIDRARLKALLKSKGWGKPVLNVI
ncbi:MAG TPA: hypothetical protein PKD55_01375 [Bellilinea sp.]|nr:hypothetical protein [Bellilinea sp.]